MMTPVAEAADRFRQHPASQQELARIAVANLALMDDYKGPVAKEFPSPCTYANLFERELEPFRSKTSEVGYDVVNYGSWPIPICHRALEEDGINSVVPNALPADPPASASTAATPGKTKVRRGDPAEVLL